MRKRRFPSGNSGFTLIEILIALTLGAVLIGSIIFSVIGAGRSGRSQDAVGQMTENGQIALNLLASQVRMAGYWSPPPLSSLDPQTSIWGCRTSGAITLNTPFDSLLCPADGGNDVFAVRYDGRNPDGSGEPRDCLGNGSPASDLVNADGGIVYNRFYVSTSPSGAPALYCLGNGGGTGGQPLIENVEALQIRYGVAAVNPPPTDPVLIDPPIYSGEVVRYVTADDLIATPGCPRAGADPNSWCAVTSVRLCITMRTEDRTADAANAQFLNCDGEQQQINDRRVRRTMVTTVSLRNRIATP